MIKKVLVGSVIAMSVAMLPVTASATTYWSGYFTTSSSFTTQSFYAPSGTLYYKDYNATCNPYGGYRVELWKSGGSREDYQDLGCFPNGADHTWSFNSKSSGNHYLKFVYVWGGKPVSVSRYVLYR